MENEKAIEMLTSFDSPKRVCVLGNEAVARGALEANVEDVFAYPGTPSTEISDIFSQVNEFESISENQYRYPDLVKTLIYFEYSTNEKIALEKAIACAIGHKNALCVMKNVGMNVASDALMTIAYQTINASLVIVICDDPNCHSSSNEQDSRYWGKMASVPVFNPATPADALSMTKDAFRLSEKLKLPVIVRMTTRVSHARGMLVYHKIRQKPHEGTFMKSPQNINIPAQIARAHEQLLEKLESASVKLYFEKNNIFLASSLNKSFGVITSGVPTAYLLEEVEKHDLGGTVDILKLGLVHPFPEKNVLHFLQKGLKKVLILEELDPLIENEVRLIAQKNQIDIPIYGKGFSSLRTTGEYSLDIVNQTLADFTGYPLKSPQEDQLPGAEEFLKDLPGRPPSFCVGCPHRATYYALKLVLPREREESIICGDIGCMAMGALPPFKMIDTINHMGMSISMAQGLAMVLGDGKLDAEHPESGSPGAGSPDSKLKKKVIAVVGDGTFFHSGIPSLLNAKYTQANITVIILDNRTIAMTGGQENPGGIQHEKYAEVELETLIKGLGVPQVTTMDPFDIKDSYHKIAEAVSSNGISVVISQSPCVRLGSLPSRKKGRIVVDHSLCKTCFNHDDLSLNCSQVCSEESGLARARAKIAAPLHIPGAEQRCPANICNHGFFNSILAQDYKTALEIVRDKMLFGWTCGQLCHHPCEERSGESVPIKKLKKFVSGIEVNFNDFSGPKRRAEQGVKNGKRITIIGAGPAGLSAAYDLVLAGYSVTLFEKEREAGGLIKFCIPDFRMKKEELDHEINFLTELGVNFQFDTALGKDIFLDDLSRDFDGVILAVGMGISSTLDVVEKNIPAEKKFNAIDFLTQYNRGQLRLKPAAKILVIGGGNSAIDAARTAQKIDPDNQVILSCIESSKDMPAFKDEIIEAARESIQFCIESYLEDCVLAPSGMIQVSLNSYWSNKLMKSFEVDYIITAIGQKGESVVLKNLEAIRQDEKGRVINGNNGSVSFLKTHEEPPQNIFVAGDFSSGNHMSLIGAIGSGKKAVIGIRQLLENYSFSYEGEEALNVLNENSLLPMQTGLFVENHPPLTLNEVETGIRKFDLFQPCERCNHCIDNFGCPALIKTNGKISVDPFTCTVCGLCIDVCPNNAIQWREEITESVVA